MWKDCQVSSSMLLSNYIPGLDLELFDSKFMAFVYGWCVWLCMVGVSPKTKVNLIAL